MNETFLIILALITPIALVVLVFRLRGSTKPPQSAGAPAENRDPLVNGRSAVEILERMAEGVVVVGDDLSAKFVNPAARRLLGLQPGDLPRILPAVEITEVARDSLAAGKTIDRLIEVFYPARRTLKVQADPLENDSGAVIVMQDVSEEVHTQRVRREFVAHASHEMKSPVASLQVLAEAVHGAVASGDDGSARRFSERLLSESERLGKLVGDLLDLSRLEDSTLLPEEPCDLAAVARREAGDALGPAQDANVELQANIDDELWVKGDPRQLALLMRNLLANAIQYSTAEGHVSLDAKGVGRFAVIRVTDDGIGIPLEAQPRIFERFYRVDRARSRERGGTGLGLAIVRHVTEMHGGDIEVHSELGHGSTFTVRIPLLEAVHKHAPPEAPSESSTERGPSRDKETA